MHWLTSRCTTDREKEISNAYEITAWLGFDFEGRGDKYSKQQYHWYHFSGTDYDAGNNRNAIFKIQGEGKGWSESVDDEGGNADFLMFAGRKSLEDACTTVSDVCRPRLLASRSH